MATVHDTNLVVAALRGAAEAFAPEELAHLALTGKVELAVRDRMVWWLARNLDTPGLMAVREWSRVDLAVVDSHDPAAPVLAVEGKAFYHFDAASRSGLAAYTGKVRRDLVSLARWPRARGAVVLLSTHINDPVDRTIADRIVKYASGTNRLLAAHGGDGAAARAQAEASVAAAFGLMGRVHGPLVVGEGSPWGMGVAVVGWVVQPEDSDGHVLTDGLGVVPAHVSRPFGGPVAGTIARWLTGTGDGTGPVRAEAAEALAKPAGPVGVARELGISECWAVLAGLAGGWDLATSVVSQQDSSPAVE